MSRPPGRFFFFLLLLFLFFFAGGFPSSFGQDRPVSPDVNSDNAVDANDALILYYSYSLNSVLGTGRGGGSGVSAGLGEGEVAGEAGGCEVFLAVETAAVVEGNPVVFVLTAREARSTAFAVEITLEAAGEDFGVATGTRTVVFEAGEATATLRVATEDDRIIEATWGTVTATLPCLGDPDGEAITAQAVVVDDDRNSLSSTQGGGGLIDKEIEGEEEENSCPASIVAQARRVVEGSPAVFVLTANEAPQTPFAVHVDVRSTGGSGVTDGTRAVAFAPGVPVATLSIETQDDEVVEAWGRVLAALQCDAAAGAAASAAVRIADDDVAISIAPETASVVEGSPVEFILTASEPPLTAFTVSVVLSATGDFGVMDGTHPVKFGIGETTATLRVETQGDEVSEMDGTVTATIGDGFGYTVGASSSADAPGAPGQHGPGHALSPFVTASVAIVDDDVTVSIAASAATVVEGDPAVFVLTSSKVPVTAFTAEVELTSTGDFGVATGTHPVAFEVGEITATLRVETQGDDVVEAWGAVTATVHGDTASVTIADDDVAISIAPRAPTVAEGAPAEFLLTASEPPPTAFTVKVQPVLSDGFGEAGGPRRVAFGAGARTATLRVETQGDDVVEAWGTATATVRRGLGYQVGAPETASVAIADDDVKVSFLRSLPLAVEGEPAAFVLRASEAPLTPFTVEVTLAATGEFEVTPTGVHTLVFEAATGTPPTMSGAAPAIPTALFGAGAPTATLRVDTQGDDTPETAGTVTATAETGFGYAIGPRGEAEVIIADDDGGGFRECADCPEMAVVRGGTFTMGSPAGEAGRQRDEGPQHEVTLGRVAVGRYEVTFAEWDACHVAGGCAKVPEDRGWGRGTRPVINVDRDDAKQYVAWLSRRTGERYRLLTEAEWEYAARAGTRTAYPWGNSIGSNNANCYGCGSEWDNREMAPVGSFPANAFGLYDMLGNAYEWVEDCRHPDYENAPTDGRAWGSENDGDCSRHGLRGGSAFHRAGAVRSANRDWSLGSRRDNISGFRVARTMLPGGADYEPEALVIPEQSIMQDAWVSIRVETSTVVEGETAEFLLRASPAPRTAITVNVEVMATQGDFGVTTGVRPVAFEAGETSATLRVDTGNDYVIEADGTVTAMVREGVDYEVNAVDTASVTIEDDDVAISIRAGASPVMEGMQAEFVLSATEAPRAAFTVNVALATESGFQVATGTHPVAFGAGETSATLRVDIRSNDVIDADGTVTATVVSGTGYEVGAPVSARVAVVDDHPMVSIRAADLSPVPEGTQAVFVLTASETPRTAAFTVNVALAAEGDFGVVTGVRPVAFGAGATTATLRVDTQGDDILEADGAVTAMLRDGSGYAAGDPDTAEVAIADDDNGPFRECADCPEMTVVPGGTFTMGSPADEQGRQADEGPRHEVTITRFAVGRYEVTFAEWDACHADGGCTDHPDDRGWGRGARPVINVDWDDAKEYVAWLSRKTGETYRLLSESEWEYAARAGTRTAYPWGNSIGSNHANCDGCGSEWDGREMAPVGSFAANAFGLYDTSGNAYEWVEDCWHRNFENAPTDGRAWGSENGGDCSRHVLRGGSAFDRPGGVRSANRLRNIAGRYDDISGFRVARTLD